MTIPNFNGAAFSIAMQGNQSPDKMTLMMTSFDGSNFVVNLSNKLELQPNVGGFMSRADAVLLQAYLITVLGS